MQRTSTIALILAVLVAFLAVGVVAEKAEFENVGAKKCKGCHKDLYAAWLETPHATTFDKLSDEEKKNEACLKCHTSGTVAKDGSLMEGVQCEACHGPGSAYKSAKIMSKSKWKADPETHKKMAIEAGLLYPVEKDCVKCHTPEGNDNFKEFKYAEKQNTSHPVKKEEAGK